MPGPREASGALVALPAAVGLGARSHWSSFSDDEDVAFFEGGPGVRRMILRERIESEVPEHLAQAWPHELCTVLRPRKGCYDVCTTGSPVISSGIFKAVRKKAFGTEILVGRVYNIAQADEALLDAGHLADPELCDISYLTQAVWVQFALIGWVTDHHIPVLIGDMRTPYLRQGESVSVVNDSPAWLAPTIQADRSGPILPDRVLGHVQAYFGAAGKDWPMDEASEHPFTPMLSLEGILKKMSKDLTGTRGETVMDWSMSNVQQRRDRQRSTAGVPLSTLSTTDMSLLKEIERDLCLMHWVRDRAVGRSYIEHWQWMFNPAELEWLSTLTVADDVELGLHGSLPKDCVKIYCAAVEISRRHIMTIAVLWQIFALNKDISYEELSKCARSLEQEYSSEQIWMKHGVKVTSWCLERAVEARHAYGMRRGSPNPTSLVWLLPGPEENTWDELWTVGLEISARGLEIDVGHGYENNESNWHAEAQAGTDNASNNVSPALCAPAEQWEDIIYKVRHNYLSEVLETDAMEACGLQKREKISAGKGVYSLGVPQGHVGLADAYVRRYAIEVDTVSEGVVWYGKASGAIICRSGGGAVSLRTLLDDVSREVRENYRFLKINSRDPDSDSWCFLLSNVALGNIRLQGRFSCVQPAGLPLHAFAIRVVADIPWKLPRGVCALETFSAESRTLGIPIGLHHELVLETEAEEPSPYGVITHVRARIDGCSSRQWLRLESVLSKDMLLGALVGRPPPITAGTVVSFLEGWLTRAGLQLPEKVRDAGEAWEVKFKPVQSRFRWRENKEWEIRAKIKFIRATVRGTTSIAAVVCPTQASLEALVEKLSDWEIPQGTRNEYIRTVSAAIILYMDVSASMPTKNHSKWALRHSDLGEAFSVDTLIGLSTGWIRVRGTEGVGSQVATSNLTVDVAYDNQRYLQWTGQFRMDGTGRRIIGPIENASVTRYRSEIEEMSEFQACASRRELCVS